MILSSFSAPVFRRRLTRLGLSLSFATGLVLSLATSAFAGAPKAPVKPREPFVPPYDAIKSVDATAMTLSVCHMNSKDTTVKNYKIIPTTEIQVNGEKAPATSLQVGMKVSITPAMDATVAERVVASPKPATPPSPAKPKKP